jgi:Uma2 family endonuclease
MYARQGVPHLWIIDPDAHLLEAFSLTSGKWLLLGTWSEDAVATGVQPFPDHPFHMSHWWLPR